MNVEVHIYLSGLREFFGKHPDELYNLIPKGCEQLFYDKIAHYSELNSSKNEDVILTKEQMLKVCVEVNREYEAKAEIPVFSTPYGKIILN